MSKSLKHRLFSIGVFMFLNFLYGIAVVTDQVEPEVALVYGLIGLLWSAKIRKARHHYHRKESR